MTDYTELELDLFSELHETEDTLAAALGYPWVEEYGYAIGDHTVVTMAMELYEKLQGISWYAGPHKSNWSDKG